MFCRLRYTILLVSLLTLTLNSLTGCKGGDSTTGNNPQAQSTSFLITDMSPDFGLASTLVTIQTEGVTSNNVVVVFDGQEIVPDSVSADFKTIVFTVPGSAKTGPLYLKEGTKQSNSLRYNYTVNGVIPPIPSKIVVNSDGDRVAIGYLFVSLFEASDTRAEADRLAALVSGSVVGRIELGNTWQITVNATSFADLQAIAASLELDPDVKYTFVDIEVSQNAINWSLDPGRGDQRARNRVEEGAALYESHVHPTDASKIQPFFMSVGVIESGVDFNLEDFSSYSANGTSSSGNVTIYSTQVSSATNPHGSNVTGILAAELGNSRNAGVLRALGNSHGGVIIDSGYSSGLWSGGQLARTNQQLEAGISVINWSWGIERKGALNCNGKALVRKDSNSDNVNVNVKGGWIFDRYANNLNDFFTDLTSDYPEAIIVRSAGNSATDASDPLSVAPAPDHDQLIIVGAHTTGGTYADAITDDEIDATNSDPDVTTCFDTTINTDVKRAYYSNYGDRVDIAASGAITGVNNSQHITISNIGTSFAAPLVTATVALIRSINPNLSPVEIKNLLRKSALPIENKVVTSMGHDVFTRPLSSAESSSHAGKGARLNVEGAIQAAIDNYQANSSRIGNNVVTTLGNGVDKITQTIDLTIPSSGAVFDKVDIMFLVDVSSSYNDDISTFVAKADNLITAFSAAGNDVEIGLSSFSDFPVIPYGQPGLDYAYSLDQVLTTDFNALKTELSNLTILSGSDSPESQLEALFQASQTATGWRTGSLPIIFLATDAAFHNSDTNTAYPGTGYTATLADLSNLQAKVFGLQSGGSIPDVVNISIATGGEAFDLSRDSAEIVQAVQTAIDNTSNNITVEMVPFGDFAQLIESITPKIMGASPGDPYNNVSPGDSIEFDVVFTRGNLPPGTKQTFSFRFIIIAEGVATIQEIPITVILE